MFIKRCNILKSEVIINSIERTIDDTTHLINNINSVIMIAQINDHRGIFAWASWELNGYKDREALPSYRNINTTVHKDSSGWVAEREYKETIEYLKPINEVLNNSCNEWVKYETINIWGTPLTYFIHKSQFLKILRGVIKKIKEYLFKVKRDLRAVQIDLSFIENKQYKEYQSKLLKEKLDISKGVFDDYLVDEKEKETFTQNIDLLLKFEYERNYKFCIIMMGSILEFLLIRLCEKENIHNGNNFAFYINKAIEKDIFQEEMRWKLVQTHLRDFRNYIHIQKEMESTEIDENWYNTMKQVFEVLYSKFKSS